MSVGSSGRIVIEIDPEVKSRLYAALRFRETTLKDWFLTHAEAELEHTGQLQLELSPFPGERHSTPSNASEGEHPKPLQA